MVGNGHDSDPVPAGRVGSPIYAPPGIVLILALASAFLGGAGLSTQEIVVVNVAAFVAADAPFILNELLRDSSLSFQESYPEY